MIEITSIDDPRIDAFRSLKDGPKGGDTFIAENEKIILKLIRCGLPVHKILAHVSFYEKNQSELESIPDEFKFFSSHIPLLEQIVGFHLHHGALALAQKPANVPLDELGSRIVILNGISSAENVGAIIRNATGLGFHSMIIDSKTCPPYIRRTVRVSMGNIFWMKIHETDDLPKTIHELRKRGTTVWAAENRPWGVPLPNATLTEKTALVLGSEGYGIDADVMEACDHTVRIPMDETVYAFNVACASAILLYHFSPKGAL